MSCQRTSTLTRLRTSDLNPVFHLYSFRSARILGGKSADSRIRPWRHQMNIPWMSHVRLHRYWLELDIPLNHPSRLEGISLGIGVTAFDVEDAIAIVRQRYFPNDELPPIRKLVEDVVIPDLLPKVQRIMSIPVWRGVWFPYQSGWDLSDRMRGRKCLNSQS